LVESSIAINVLAKTDRNYFTRGLIMAFQSGVTTTLISKDSDIVGNITFSGDLEIQGLVKGSIFAKPDASASVRVVEGGRVEGEIHAPKVIINGGVKGDIHCSEHIELAAKATIEGNVHYSLIEMVKGSQVNGSLVYAGAEKKTAKVESLAVKSQVSVS
jgi:cytoskeletal protein CcmA (bactofilin family)